MKIEGSAAASAAMPRAGMSLAPRSDAVAEASAPGDTLTVPTSA